MDIKKPKDFENKSFENIDYVVSCDLLKNYSGMRILALGGAITLFVSLITISMGNGIIEKSIQNIIILLSSYVSIRVIGSINSNVYARCIHLEWIEKKLNVIGFFTYWNKYVIDKSKNASSNAFVLSCIGFNYIGSILAIISSIQLIIRNIYLKNIFINEFTNALFFECLKGVLILCVLVSSVFFFIINHFYVKSIKTKRLIPRLRASLEKERSLVSPSKIKYKN
jgi:hypothetical protein